MRTITDEAKKGNLKFRPYASSPAAPPIDKGDIKSVLAMFTDWDAKPKHYIVETWDGDSTLCVEVP